MKNTTFILLVLMTNILFAQINGFNYKALITDNGNAVSNQSVDVKFTLYQNGNPVYQETQTLTTDNNGIISANIGEGTTLTGSFNTLDWQNGMMALQVEIDTGSGYQDFGTNELKSVPFAKYAEKAGNVFSGDYHDLINRPDLSDVAISGDYNDLNNTPVLFNIATQTTPATTVSDNIYHSGKMAIGTSETDPVSTYRLFVKNRYSEVGISSNTDAQAVIINSNLQQGNGMTINQNNSNSSASKSALETNYTDKINSRLAYYYNSSSMSEKGYYGLYNSLQNVGNLITMGVINKVTGNGYRMSVGVMSDITHNGTGKGFGNIAVIKGTSDEDMYGALQIIDNQGNGDHYGLVNLVQNGGNGDQYGVYNKITNVGNGDKYGSYNYIMDTAPGKHYAVYAEATKNAPDVYAGYFKGNLKIDGGKLTANTSGNADMKAYAYGEWYMGNERVMTDNVSIEKITNSSGDFLKFRIHLNPNLVSPTHYIVSLNLYSSDGFIHAIKTGSYVDVYTSDTSGNRAEKAFTFVIYKK